MVTPELIRWGLMIGIPIPTGDGTGGTLGGLLGLQLLEQIRKNKDEKKKE
jgi:hypothetical protein